MCVQLLCPSVFPAASRQNLSRLGRGSEEGFTQGLPSACDLSPCVQASGFGLGVFGGAAAACIPGEGGEARVLSELEQPVLGLQSLNRPGASPWCRYAVGSGNRIPHRSSARRGSQHARGTGRAFSEVSLVDL